MVFVLDRAHVGEHRRQLRDRAIDVAAAMTEFGALPANAQRTRMSVAQHLAEDLLQFGELGDATGGVFCDAQPVGPRDTGDQRCRVARAHCRRTVLGDDGVLRDRLRQLREFPRSGRELPEFQMANIRELIVDRYRLVYEPTGETITLAFRPGAIPLDVVTDD